MEVLTNLAYFAVGAGILGFLVRSLVKSILSRDIEQFKADLRISAFEHEIRFAKLHEKRAEVIAELYGRLANLNLLMNQLTNLLNPLTQTLEKQVGDSGNIFRQYYLANRIYFDEALCQKLDRINEKIWSAWIDYNMSKNQELDSKTALDFLIKAFKTTNEEIRPILVEIETAFRDLLGHKK